MARLSETERRQLRQATQEKVPARAVPPPPRPVKEYIAFLAFASRFTRRAQARPVPSGDHWKL